MQVRTEQRKMRPRRRVKERVLRRASIQRRSQRSVGRSGYAFSHEEGFGERITSGSLMYRKPPVRPGIGNVVVAPAAIGIATVSPLAVNPPPPSLDDSGVPSVSDGSAVSASDLPTNGVSLSPTDETPVTGLNPEPRSPVLV